MIVGPRFGEDAAVIDMGSKYLVAKTDPITFTAERIGWYAVNINANDIATLGARPRWFLAALLLPERAATKSLVQSIFDDVLRACQALRITLCGGHTEITAGLDRPIVVGQILGEVEKAKLVRKQSQRPGDAIILTKGVALEGTAILAREKRRVLEPKLGKALVRRAQGLLFRPGISVVADAAIALRAGEVHAMHDPTEGGLLSGLAELAAAGTVGLRVWRDSIPVLPETQAFSVTMGLDPLALIASGALLLVVSERTVESVLRAFRRRRIVAAWIGQVRRKAEGLRIVSSDSRERRLRIPTRDEIARLLEAD